MTKSAAAVLPALPVLLALLVLSAGPAGAADPPRFALPVDCPPGKVCDVVKLPDVDPGPGMKDYACGAMVGGENNHPGVDIAIRDMAAMNDGVTVRAAADGQVLRVRDEMADTGIYGPESREALNAVGCGNAVVIGHGDGWQTAYCHLRRGSVSVRPGQTVRTGDAIAQVGMSGLTELPHLHFQVNHGRDMVDPFVGVGRAAACGPGPRPLWTREALARLTPYRPAVVRLAGFAETETDVRTAREGRFASGKFRACAASLVFWTEIIGVKAGDRLTLRVKGPVSRPVLTQTLTIDRDRAQLFAQARQNAPAGGWPAGFYHGEAELTRGGETYRIQATGQAVAEGC